MAQWSQGLPLGSTEHCFSFSKNSTSSDTAASSTPNLSWLGCEAIWVVCVESFARVKGASQGDCATCGTERGEVLTSAGTASVCAPVDGRIGGGGAGEMKLITRARGFST